MVDDSAYSFGSWTGCVGPFFHTFFMVRMLIEIARLL
jgi:hypothetical protein